MDLVEFLRARLAEDEERARFVQRERGDQHEIEPWRLSWQDEYDLLCIEPSRALAEVEAKRRIVATFVDLDTHPNRLVYAQLQQQWVALSAVMAALALPYADHPDYRDERRP